MWLDKVGGVTVERITDVKRSYAQADRSPAKGVMHTTEGGWSGSLNVFRYNTGTPTFMLGRDGTTRVGVGYNGKLRLAQFMPIGEMALTLENGSGGVETNRDCLVQIELVAHCLWTPWLPDPETTKLLNDLMIVLRDKAGIPLVHAGDGSRSTSRWTTKAGWFGHGEAPENDHTDPRALRWDVILKGETQQEEEDEMLPSWFKPWKWWYIMERPRGVPLPSISGLPADVPQWAYDDVGQTALIHNRLGPPVQYQNWRNGRLLGTPMPENLPIPIPQGWWDGAVVDHKFAEDYAEKVNDPLQVALAAKIQEVVRLQNELASALHDLELARQEDDTRVAELEAEAERVRVLLTAAMAELND